MYTQCPECSVAFRVTAEVLKMAAGKVRCGGCGVAFNALAHLSEEKPPARRASAPPPNPRVPELEPERPGELTADTPPKTISAEQSAALLKTLDQLAGEDIRIEDTGVEWRVIDANEEDVEDEQPYDEHQLIADTGTLKFVIEGEDEDGDDDDPSQAIDEMRFDDNTILPDDFDDVADVRAPAAAIEARRPVPEPPPDAPQIDLDLSQPEEWDDLLGDLDEPAVREQPAVAEERDDADGPLDMDTQFALQAEALGIDLSGMHEAIDEGFDVEETDDDLETSIEEDLMAAAFEAEAAVQKLEDTASGEAVLLDEDETDAGEDEIAIELQEEELEVAEDDIEDIAHGFDESVEKDIATLSMSLEDDDDEPEAEPGEEVDSLPTSSGEHVVLEMSEEEKTLNMMIDQELFNIAVEDEDGFASTIVQVQPNRKVDDEISDNRDASAEEDKKKSKDKSGDEERDAGDSAPKKKHPPALAVETIIMEGEFVRGELDRERFAADELAQSGDPGLSIPLHREKDDYEKSRELPSGRSRAGLYAGIGALVLLLLLQIVHQSREALATVPAFSSAVGPIYRMLGQPLTPTWNIAGWRFEATKDDLDESGNTLTIYSRVGNNSDEALPYPLVHLSLTDRFEDVIGSIVFEPGDYLPESADPRRHVPPGNTFNAVISIDSPPEDAYGYKLNVCYRLAAGQLRCADFDFK